MQAHVTTEFLPGADVETELRRRFTTDGHGGRVSPSTRRDTVRARRRDTVRSDTAEPGSPLAGAIAASVHSAVAGAR